MTKFNVFFFASGFWIYIVLGLVLVLVPGDYMFIFNLPNTPFTQKPIRKKSVDRSTNLRSTLQVYSSSQRTAWRNSIGGEVIEGLVM